LGSPSFYIFGLRIWRKRSEEEEEEKKEEEILRRVESGRGVRGGKVKGAG